MVQNVCRICAKDTDSSKAVNLFENSKCKFIRQIKLVTGVLLKCEYNLPEIICQDCQRDLNSAAEFRKLCLRVQKKWQQDIREQEKQLLNRRTNRRSTNCSRDIDSDDMEIPLKVEHQNFDNQDDGVDHLAPTTNINEEKSPTLSDASMSASPKMPSTKSLHQSKPKEQRSKPALPIFFCDQCGNNITGKSSFDRHLRKHANIRPYKCELCPARFLSAGELKGHQVMHTGDRNFPCRYCERKYVNYSGRLRHERNHTNDRPFVCAQCGKSFTNSYILKNHMLIHTGERLFRCDLCERSFSRPTHLKTHFRSNTHKQNVERQLSTSSLGVSPNIRAETSESADVDIIPNLAEAAELENNTEILPETAQILGPTYEYRTN